jgi:hypothetical protein
MKPHTRKQLLSLMYKKLAESCLDKRDAKRMQITVLTADEVPAHRGAFRMPYFTLEGEPTDFYRLRYLEESSGFAVLTELAKQRYWQQAGSLNEVYFPPFLDWPRLLRDV